MPKAPPPGSSHYVELGETRPAAGEVPSASKIYRAAMSKNGFPHIEGVTTLYELFDRSAKAHADKPCLGHRPVKDGAAGDYEYQTYKQVAERVANIASGLAQLGITTKQRVGVYGTNSPEWMIAMQACNRMSYECVPLYDSLGENAIEFIVDHSEAVATFVDAKKLPSLAKALALIKNDRFKAVVYWGTPDAAAVEAIKAKGLSVTSFVDLESQGAAAPAAPVPPKPEDLCTIMYTSGTTGDPKGVMLTHKAVVSTVASLDAFLVDVGYEFTTEDVLLSYLPLAHIFDRTSEELFLCKGAKVAYWQGDITKLVDDIGASKPTLFIGVPRVFDRIYAGVYDKINAAGGLKKKIFNWAFKRKAHFIKAGFPVNEAAPFCDKLVFNTIKQRIGGNVRVICSGGAPLAAHVEAFLQVAMCAPVVQGYGLTETCAASTISKPNNISQAFTVGPPQPNTEVRFESVPEMKYDALDAEAPAGEILLRGPGLFSGYYKQEDKTAEVMDADGFFHTGDIGVLTPGGGIRIVDRKKNIFKLSQGEYVAVEKLEATYKKADPVEQVWVYGNSFKSCLIAVVVPKKDALMAWASANGQSGSFEEVVKSDAAAKWMQSQLAAVGKVDKLKGYEIVKAVKLDTEAFGVENDLLTPTFKLKRPQLQKRYQADIDAMYTALGE